MAVFFVLFRDESKRARFENLGSLIILGDLKAQFENLGELVKNTIFVA